MSPVPPPPVDLTLSPCSAEIVNMLSAPPLAIERPAHTSISVPQLSCTQSSRSPRLDDAARTTSRFDIGSADSGDDEDGIDGSDPRRRAFSVPLPSFEGTRYRRKRESNYPSLTRQNSDSVLSPRAILKKVYGDSLKAADTSSLMGKPKAEPAAVLGAPESTKRMHRNRAVGARLQPPPPAGFLPSIPTIMESI